MPEYSSDCLAVLRLLKDRHNVLISGPPGTGKSLLLSEVAHAFVATAQSGPVHVPGAGVPIPKTPPIASGLKEVLPSAERTDRKVFRTVFHQNSKYREFVSGLVPVSTDGGGTKFQVTAGTLYRASEHAARKDGAALLIIDEINRGPAVQVFGGSIVAIESDKRLAPDGSARLQTQFFEVLRPENGQASEYALPHPLYLLAAMNQADTSVEPLDVAFLRRWEPFFLYPQQNVLRKYFGLPAGVEGELPASPTAANDVFEAAVRAWEAVNARIRLGRGPEFQIGHGVLMAPSGSPPTSLEGAKKSVSQCWTKLRAHIDEVFFGDVRGIAAILNVADDVNHPYKLEDASFADEPRLRLDGPSEVSSETIYGLLRAVAG